MEERKQLTLRDVQDVSLEIFLDVHEFCMKNGIKYCMSGGTLLGAVRHKGFIPWDDDVDLFMLRPDYDRFIATYKSDRYVLLTMDNDKDYFLPYAHVADMDQTIIEYNYDPFSRKKTGVKIDIFPLETVSNDEKDFDKQFQRGWRLWKVFARARTAFWSFSKDKSLKYNAGLFARKTVTLGGRLVFWLGRMIDRNARKYKFGTTDYVALLSFPVPRAKQRHRLDVFADTVLLDFEGHKVCAPIKYEEFLITAFGPDYMTPPPEDQRVGPHTMRIYYK